MSVELPTRAQVVVVGGGIIGASLAYHLTKRGITDVLLVEQGQLTGGTTWHAAGLVSQLKPTHSLTKLATYSNRLFEELEDETGQATGYRAPGSISVASDLERWEEMRRGISMASTVGVEIREIDMDELTDKVPLLRTDDLVGALYIPKDGQTSPVDTTMALIKGARQGGATVVEGVAVQRLLKNGDTCVGIETEDGHVVEAETVVMAAGMWTRQLAETIGVNVPLQACEHFYIVTEPLQGVERGMPIVRDPSNYTYFKEETGKIMAGFFEPKAKIWKLDGIPRDFCFGTLPEDWDHLGPIFEAACHRMPALADAGLQLFFNGPEAFTPDGTFYLGESPEVDRCFVAAGFNSVGIQTAGGVGWVLADWIVDGYPPMDLSGADIRRSFSFQSDRSYLKERISESLGLLYAMHWPFRQYESARGIRKSSLHDALDKDGAVFGETAGWERPNWFADNDQLREYEYSYGKQNWHDNMRAECEAVRHAVGMFDQSSFAKFLVAGPEALAVLERLSANSVDVELGKGVYTQWLNERGGIEADLTVTRLSQDEFWVVTSAASQTRDWAWLRRACRGHSVEISDVTEDWSVLGVMGPHSRGLLESVSHIDLSNQSCPFGSMTEIVIAGVSCNALRMSYVGELGWELYIPADQAGAVYEEIRRNGDRFGLRLAGFHAMNALRLEAGYRHWGHDISDEDTPLEAGLGFAIAWDKPVEFIGREALLKQRGETLAKRLIQFRVEDPDLISYHDDPIFRNSVYVGRTTGGMWSHTQDRCLSMAYLNNPSGVDQAWLDSGDWQIEIGTRRRPVTPSIRSFYDPKNQKVRS
ncbi:MAG: FAD-dependent oxidoreductase [Acidimicrobiaceae bacterium]|nr:FAD-dependent oxidoreductase [Acidimicrobiaceae bacterium]|tara:strand:+ start:6385 stop:8832 length:2448 start_codon:yes stop_codon:yes gene_type:complete